MSSRKRYCFLSVCILAFAITGCASNVPQLIRKQPPADIEISEVQLKSESFVGSVVRWGGTVVNVKNLRTHTMVEILARPLAKSGKPDDSGRGKGRFLARISGFVDPEEYTQGRLLTVTGKLSRIVKNTIGEYLYDYPVVEAEARHLWPEVEVYPYPYYRDPFYYPWYPYGYRHPYYRW
ncbi:MAG: Slp/YeaY family lipoprotein [Gammaproteobacteria bacterium]|nr:Slp/YeaY family lipoprotein [Gammaproteobacteria bacterium]